jgi:hypothetical protein
MMDTANKVVTLMNHYFRTPKQQTFKFDYESVKGFENVNLCLAFCNQNQCNKDYKKQSS